MMCRELSTMPGHSEAQLISAIISFHRKELNYDSGPTVQEFNHVLEEQYSHSIMHTHLA